MSLYQTKPDHRYSVVAVHRGYVVLSPDGVRTGPVLRTRRQAEEMCQRRQAAADAGVKRGPRPCLCCGKTFESDGIHNRMCNICRVQSDALGDAHRPQIQRR